MSSVAHLNLARKWRSQQFDQIVGQDLPLRMLKNSLYLQSFFPVYLFSGQRGCGKTTTARVFASAINCEHYDLFRKDPKQYTIPCLNCYSCQAMLAGKHPDFIEMDAASHTGVDNVRNIIDAASLMPIMGRKKIYLIDEAHMLSKAAFNAFLKILEEPPTSVLFILATTDADKIIETVRSRCFQLFFKAIDTEVLTRHLAHICEQESIPYEPQGLELIVQETDGSARDALNLLEAVRFSAGRVTKKAVVTVLGHIDDESIIALLQAVVVRDSVALLKTLRHIEQMQVDAGFLWRSFLQLLHACIWLKHGIEPRVFVQHISLINKIIEQVNWRYLHAILDRCYAQEQLFLKTAHQHAFIEMILLQIVVGDSKGEADGGEFGFGFSSGAVALAQPTASCDAEQEYEEETANDFSTKWQLFIREVSVGEDRLLASIFKQSVCRAYDDKTNVLEVEFCKKFIFFQEAIEEKKDFWMVLLKKIFGEEIIFNPLFTGEDIQTPRSMSIAEPVSLPVTHRIQSNPRVEQKTSYAASSKGRSYSANTKGQLKAIEPLLDVSSKEKWPLTHLLFEHFDGTVHAVPESTQHHD